MIARLRHEPRSVPADGASRVADELFQILSVILSGKGAGRVLLIRIALALMPKHGAEPLWPQRLHSCNEGIIRRAFASPRTVGEFLHAAFDGRRIWKRRPSGQPFAHTRRTDPTRDDAHGHILLRHHRIREGRNETATTPARPRLRIIRDPPCPAIEGSHSPGLGRLLFLPMVGGIRLTGDDKHLTNAHMRHAAERELFPRLQKPHLKPPPAAGGAFDRARDLAPHRNAAYPPPRNLCILPHKPRFDHGIGGRIFG